MFDKVVFAGGGHRCWWQAGFWEQVSGEIELHPRVIGAVSSGAVTACLLYGNDTRRALAWYERELKGVRSNINWLNLLRRGQPLLPHAAIHRKALRALLGGENFRQLMWRAPEIRVQYSRLPAGMNPARGVLTGMLANSVERSWHGSLHPTACRRLGLTSEVRRVQDCRSERELIDLLVASSSAPPFTPVELIDGEPCLDGGLVDELPIGTVADVPGQTLVITTRRYRSLAPVFAREGLIYVQPSEQLAVSGWDCTSPSKYQKTYDLGRRDGEKFLKTFALGQHREAGLRAPVLVAGSEELDGAGVEGSGRLVLGEAGAAKGDALERGALTGETLAVDALAADVLAADALAADADAGPALPGASVERSGPPTHADRPAPTRAVEEGVASEAEAGAHSDEMRATEDADDGALFSGTVSDDEVMVAGEPDPRAVRLASAHRGSIKGKGRGQTFPASAEDGAGGVLDVSAKLANYREPTDAGMAEDLSASQPAASDGQLRSGRSLRASNI